MYEQTSFCQKHLLNRTHTNAHIVKLIPHNKKSMSVKTKIIFASGRCCHGPYHGLFLSQPLRKENIRDDMNLT